MFYILHNILLVRLQRPSPLLFTSSSTGSAQRAVLVVIRHLEFSVSLLGKSAPLLPLILGSQKMAALG